MSTRHVSLVAVLALTVAGVATVATLERAGNPSAPPGVFSAGGTVESTALYCTGLTNARDGALGSVTLINTASNAREVSVDASSNTGQRWATSLRIAGHSSKAVRPSTQLGGDSFGLTALVSGGGVLGVVATSTRGAEAPCIATGETSWYGAGFDTTVGSDAALSIYNPTATPAVLNVTTYSASGFAAPAPFQGISVGPHAQVRLDLGTQIVATANIGVRVKVLRGVVAVVGVQRSGSHVSFNPGSISETSSVLFARVTTVNGARAEVRVANPSPRPATVTVHVTLKAYTLSPLVATVRPYSSTLLKITPNPAIPAAGYASVQMTSSEPVIASLATGDSRGIWLSAPGIVAGNFLAADVYGVGFDAVALSNVSTRSINVEALVTEAPGRAPTRRVATIAPNTTSGFSALFGEDLTKKIVALHASAPTLQVTLTLPTSPAGDVVLGPLDGR